MATIPYVVAFPRICLYVDELAATDLVETLNVAPPPPGRQPRNRTHGQRPRYVRHVGGRKPGLPAHTFTIGLHADIKADISCKGRGDHGAVTGKVTDLHGRMVQA
jgi:hypothetical protein